MNVDYGYQLLTGFTQGYFSINAFPKSERFRALQVLSELYEAKVVCDGIENDHLVTLTRQGWADFRDLADGKPVPYPKVPAREDRATQKRAEVISKIYDL